MVRPARLMAFAMVACFMQAAVSAESFYPQRLDDKANVYLSKDRFSAVGDGVADDTNAL